MKMETAAGGSVLSLAALAEPINKLRIAVWSDAGPFCPTSADVGARMQTVADALSRAGAKVLDRARPEFDPAHSHQLFFALLVAATAAHSLSDDEFKGLIEKAESQDASAATAVARMRTVRLRDWVRLDEARTQLRWKWRRFFDDVDFLITPIMPVTAFAHDHSPREPRTIRVDGVELNLLGGIGGRCLSAGHGVSCRPVQGGASRRLADYRANLRRSPNHPARAEARANGLRLSATVGGRIGRSHIWMSPRPNTAYRFGWPSRS